MKKTLFPMTFLLALIFLAAVPLQSARADAIDVPFLATIQTVQLWMQTFQNEVETALHNMNSKIASSMADHMKKQVAAAGERDIAQKMVNDRQKEFELSQATSKEAAQKNGDTAYAAIMKYSPTAANCINYTNQIIRNYNYSQGVSRQQTLSLVSFNTNNLQKGLTGGSSGATSQVASNRQAAMKALANALANGGNLSTSQIANVSDKLVVEQQCGNQGSNGPTCYNQWLESQIKNNMTVSNGDKAPWNAQLNPQTAAYFIQRGQWENSRSAALETVNRYLPKLYKSMDYYNQAILDYANAYGIPQTGSGDSGQTRLNAQYPYASTIGLDHYEFEETEFNAMMAMKDGASISATPGNMTLAQTPEQRNDASQVIQAAAAQMEIAKMEKEELQAALKTLGVPPPNPSAGAISVNGSSSSTTTQ